MPTHPRKPSSSHNWNSPHPQNWMERTATTLAKEYGLYLLLEGMGKVGDRGRQWRIYSQVTGKVLITYYLIQGLDGRKQVKDFREALRIAATVLLFPREKGVVG